MTLTKVEELRQIAVLLPSGQMSATYEVGVRDDNKQWAGAPVQVAREVDKKDLEKVLGAGLSSALWQIDSLGHAIGDLNGRIYELEAQLQAAEKKLSEYEAQIAVGAKAVTDLAALRSQLKGVIEGGS